MKEEKHKINSITGLKILLLLAIFIWHCGILKAPDVGARACELLFICSGFCMAYNYYQKKFEGTIYEATQFTLKRLKKFYILYIITMILAIIYSVFCKGYRIDGNLIAKTILNVLLLQPWWKLETFNGASWFIAVLTFCYFCTPFIFSILKKYSKQRNWIFFIILSIRLLIEFGYTHCPSIIYFSMHTYPIVRMLEYFLACIIGIFFLEIAENQEEKNQKGKIIIAISEIIVVFAYLFFVIYYNNVLYRGIFVLLGLGLVFIIALENGIISKILSNKCILWLAKYEMEIFLLHQVVINFIEELGIYRWNLVFISFVITLVLAITYKKLNKLLIERYQKIDDKNQEEVSRNF